MYCVIKNTITVISNDTHNNLEIYYQDALSAGFEREQVEILTQKQYNERKSLEPIPEPQPSEIEKLRLEQAQANSELIQLIMMMGGA